MRKVQILTDSCADLCKEIRDEYGIDYMRMQTVYQGKETPASLDFEYYTPKELYDIMRNGERVTTTQVPPEEFERVFGKYLAEGCDIVYVACSVKQSSSVNTGAVVAKKLLADYPDAKIYCIDSLNSCVGEGLVAIRAAEYRDQGMDAEAVYEHVMADRNKVNEFVTVHSLDALRRAGRVKGTAAFFGNLFGVKPIIIADAEGNQTPIKKVKGRKTSFAELVSLLKEAVVGHEPGADQYIYIAHADCAEEAEELKAMVLAEIPCKGVRIGYIGPIVGASIGPDAIGVFAFGKEVTFRG